MIVMKIPKMVYCIIWGDTHCLSNLLTALYYFVLAIWESSDHSASLQVSLLLEVPISSVVFSEVVFETDGVWETV